MRQLPHPGTPSWQYVFHDIYFFSKYITKNYIGLSLQNKEGDREERRMRTDGGKRWEQEVMEVVEVDEDEERDA